jgi:hypothetical protein
VETSWRRSQFESKRVGGRLGRLFAWPVHGTVVGPAWVANMAWGHPWGLNGLLSPLWRVDARRATRQHVNFSAAAVICIEEERKVLPFTERPW